MPESRTSIEDDSMNPDYGFTSDLEPITPGLENIPAAKTGPAENKTNPPEGIHPPPDKETVEKPLESEKSSEDLEKARGRAAYYQSAYQKAMGELNRSAPRLAKEIRERIKTEKTPAVQSIPSENEPPASILDLTPEQFGNLIRDNSRAAVDQMRKEEAYSNEMQQSNGVIRDFIKAGEFTKEEVNTAFQEADQFGIDIDSIGGPSSMARLVIKELNHIKLQREYGQRTAGESGIIAGKKESINAVLQPAGGSPPPKGNLTRQEEALQQMAQLGGKSMRDLSP